MILLDMKNKSTSSSSSPLSLSVPGAKPIVSFSELLKGASEKKDTKLIQNGPLVLSLDVDKKELKSIKNSIKAEKLSANLKSDDNSPAQKSQEPLELNPRLTSAMSSAEIKTLVNEAKNYLKEKIKNSDDYKKTEIKELPKTLQGLVEVAKKFGIDISKITIEDVKAHTELKAQPAKIDKQEDIKVVTPKENKDNLQKELRVEMSKEQTHDKKVQALHASESQKTIAVADMAPIDEKKVQTLHANDNKKTTAVSDTMPIDEKKVQTLHENDNKKTTVATNTPAIQTQLSNEIKKSENSVQTEQEIKSMPLFKAQSTVEHTTTQQIVEVKVNNTSKAEQKTPKEKADETLKLLLRGEKPSTSDSVLTADFSVATAKVIAPGTSVEGTKILEQLLQGEAFVDEQSSATAKVEPLGVHKAESFEVKLNEAKQMIRYLSADVKTAIEDYKPPFTRVKVQLNPQHLGEVDLTIVQRGKNLHVNISSNNAAINTLVMNANELKVQLNNSGINNATLNFSNGSQSGDTNAGGGHQQRQNEQRAHAEYSYFENEEISEEILNSLEIIVPRYT